MSDEVSAGRSARERLLDSATEEFASKGLAGARINEIAANASINKQLVYHYFGSKEGLYSEVVQRALEASRTQDVDLDLSGLRPDLALRRYIDHMVQTTWSDLRLQRLLLDANWYQARHLPGNDGSSTLRSARLKALTDILSAGQEQGLFRRDIDARELYISMIGTFSIRLTNAYTMSKTLGVDLLSPEGQEHSRSRALDLLLRGISVLAPPI